MKFFFTFLTFVFLSVTAISQECSTDSSYFSIHYTNTNINYITDAVITPQNETVALLQHPSQKKSFVTKFTSQGNILWSNEYLPDYPHNNYLEFPWYDQTQMTGILSASDSTTYVYGYSEERGRFINNTEDPPKHLVGVMVNIDKFGKIIDGRYFGNWRTDYTIENVIELNNGQLVIYLRSHFSPLATKIICIDKSGNIIWGSTLQPSLLQDEISNVRPVMKQLADGKIMVMTEMNREIDDTLVYPFLVIILKAPLKLFGFNLIDPNDGRVVNITSYECPSLTNTNVNNQFVPQIKSVAQLPGGNLSYCIDMYWPIDKDVTFYNHKVFSRRPVNFNMSSLGYYTNLTTYRPKNGSCILQSVWQTGRNGEQILLVKDSADNNLILFAIDKNGQVEWSKTYKNPMSTGNSQGVVLQKKNTNGFSIFQSDKESLTFDLLLTNSIGNTACSQLPDREIIAENDVWPWPPNKIQYLYRSFDVDFRSSPFNMIQNSLPLNQDTYCKYEYQCCKDVIDSLHPHDISICENESYELKDGTTLTRPGTYYETLKTKDGCDSVIFYNLKVIKSPSHLSVTTDTCLNSQSSVTVKASGGYNSYVWNNEIPTIDSTYTIYSTGTYPVTVTNKCGTKTDSVYVMDGCDFPIYFPNAFTPNGDLINDVLRVPPLNKNKLLSLRIYNRFGKLVFYTTQSNVGWDGTYKGKLQPAGVYVYVLDMDGLSGRNLHQKGTVALIR